MRFKFIKTGLGFLAVVLQLFSYSKTTTMVEMSDGILLATDIYSPDTDNAPWPTIVIRTPYDKDAIDPGVPLITDQHNYALVVQNTRGRFDSQGVDSVFLDDAWGEEKHDGYDCIQWIAKQSWCDGNIGTWGGSANGITQYLLAGSAPTELKCQFVMVAVPSLFHYAIFPGGQFRKYDIESWLAGQESTYMLSMFEEFPVYDTNWMRVNLAERWDSVNVPAYHVGGWYDLFLEGTLDAFRGYQYFGGPGARGRQKLLVGPWTHGIGGVQAGQLTYPSNARVDVSGEAIRWFNYWLRGEENGIADEPAVRYYQMGDPSSGITDVENTWVEADTWPVPAEPLILYLHTDQTLDEVAPSLESDYRQYQYDPDDPVQTVGGRNLVLPAGPRNQWIEGLRDDLLGYTTPVLAEPVVVAGKIAARLYASSDCTDTDWSVRISDIYPDGSVMLVADGMLKARFRNSPDLTAEELMNPGTVYRFDVDLWSSAITFAAGHRIRVSVTSSNSPRFEVNPNTGGPFMRDDPVRQTATNRVYCDAEHPSFISLPIPITGSASVKEPAPPEGSSSGLEIMSSVILNHELNFILHNPDEIDLEIFDACGRQVAIVHKGRLDSGVHTLPLPDLTEGVYFIRLWTENDRVSIKLVEID